jgi:hypothetical protein
VPQQRSFFDLPPAPEPLPANHTDTSRAAAESMAPHAGALRERVFAFVNWEHGATCDEIEHSLKLAHQTASARLWELKRAQRIVDSGRRRPTTSGRQAIVWRAA